MAHRVKPILDSTKGFTLVDLIAYLAILGIVLMSALPHFDRRPQDTATAVELFVNDVRFARAKAIISGSHVTVEAKANNRYTVVRQKVSGGSWVTDATLREVTLPKSTTFALGGATPENKYEFNTRGMQVAYLDPTNPVVLTASFSDTKGTSRTVSVYPSGQVYVAN